MPKRRRVDGADSLHSDGPTADGDQIAVTRSDIWFDDGSLVIQAENTQFKVHKGVLTRHSSVFADVFAMPHPEGEPTIEGCPVLQLQDSAEDINNFLLALYDRCSHTKDAIPLAVIAAMIRMGKKYDVPTLRDEGFARLNWEFPNTLESWDIQEADESYTRITDNSSPRNHSVLFGTVELAHQCDIKTVLPTAYYNCCHDLDGLLYGYELDDGTRSKPLSHDIQRICVMGREKLLDAQGEAYAEWVDCVGGTMAGCVTPQSCKAIGANLQYDLWRPKPIVRGLDRWSEFSADMELSGLCGPCTEYGKQWYKVGREGIWRVLPSFFGLPPWDELKNFES
ncbi:hypothetical protein DFP72DRAFT_944073 [Ephemerocybe angulata]|uniref:BTB domain-containing protein n=1 Tax=Ephemerocybe angulata TaxID=980116 RepID=A0A8H6LRV9_9AGAR|nr:hypothetical protein DFP72DRAFT_944073 [Tulosesus angulatus]